MTNLSEHPIALDLSKRIAASAPEEGPKFVAVTLIMPGMGPLPGTVRNGDSPGLFILTSNVEVGKGGQKGMMDFAFTADKPVTILYPNLTEAKPTSRIIQ